MDAAEAVRMLAEYALRDDDMSCRDVEDAEDA
jgi:hypothetical protein